MFQCRAMSLSDSGSIKGGNNLGTVIFFPLSPLFSSLPAWWKHLNCRASLAHWENSNTATLLLSHPGLDTLLQLWDCGNSESLESALLKHERGRSSRLCKALCGGYLVPACSRWEAVCWRGQWESSGGVAGWWFDPWCCQREVARDQSWECP